MGKWMLLVILLLLLPAAFAHRYFGQGNFGVGVFGMNTDPSIDSFQPSDANFSVSNGVVFVFNVTFHDDDIDALTIKWDENGTLIASNQNLSRTFNTQGIFNITANISDNLSHIFVSWIITVGEAIPIVEAPAGAVGGADGGPGSTVTQQQEQIKQELLAQAGCPQDKQFIERLTSQCRIPDNFVCDDGENFMLDKDCKVTFDDVKLGDLFRNMWFLRIMLFFSIFLLSRNSKVYPLMVVILLVLFIYNGAFIRPGAEYEKMACMDVNFLINAGYCIMPEKPVLGWIISFIMVILVINYFVEQGRVRKAKKDKKKAPKVEKQSPESTIVTFILVAMLVYAWAVIGHGITITNPKCIDIGFFVNFGECVTPTRPIVGWIIGIALIMVVLGYFIRQMRKEHKETNKQKPKTI